MNRKTKNVLIGALTGAVLGMAFAWVASDSESEEGEAVNLRPTDYFQLGIGLLTLARQFGGMIGSRD